MSRPAALATLGRVAALALAYAALGQLGLLLASTSTRVTAVWPAAGLALAAVLAWGWRVAPGIFVGSFLVTIGTHLRAESPGALAVSLAVAFAVAAGATAQALLAAFLLGRLRCPPADFASLREVACLLLIGGPVGCVVSAGIGVTALQVAGRLPAGAFASTWSSWWVADALGVIVLTPVALVAGRSTAPWARRRWAIILPCLVAYAMVVGFFLLALRMERERTSLLFAREAGELADAIRGQVEAHVEVLRGIASLWASSEAVTREEFRTFVAPALARHRGLWAVSWDPRVTGAEREALTLEARRDGLADYEITELAPDGTLRPAGVRDEYVPVLYVEPLSGSEAALGYDVASDPVRAAALQRARDTGEATATEPISLVQDASRDPGVLVFLPIYARGVPTATIDQRRAALLGYAVGIYHVRDVGESALQGAGGDMRLRLVDEDPIRGDTVAWVGGASASDDLSTSLSWSTAMQVTGRTWRLECAATAVRERGMGSAVPGTVLLTGLLFCGVLAAFLLLLTGRAIALQAEMAGREEAQRTLRQRENELRQALRLEAVGRLAGGIAHDFNNLLTAITGHLDLLAPVVRKAPEAEHDLAEARRACERAAALTRRLLVFGRREVAERTVVDLNHVARGLEAMLRRTIGPNVSLVMTLAPQPCHVEADRTQLEQVLVNLALNARDAMSEGGELVIATEVAEVPDGDAPPTGPCAQVTVRDTGAGIPADVLPHVFEPYFTTKEVNRGTGLGLSIVHGVVTEAGGRIDVDSAPGCGTTFRILLPRVASPASLAVPGEEARAAALPPGTDEPGGTERILVAEDEPMLRSLYEGVLRAKGYDVTVVPGGDEALAVARRATASFDLLVTDVLMPGMNGAVLAERLRAMQPRVRVLLVSGNPRGVIDEGEGRLPRGTSFLAKPFSPRALLLRVRECLDGPPPEA